MELFSTFHENIDQLPRRRMHFRKRWVYSNNLLYIPVHIRPYPLTAARPLSYQSGVRISILIFGALEQPQPTPFRWKHMQSSHSLSTERVRVPTRRSRQNGSHRRLACEENIFLKECCRYNGATGLHSVHTPSTAANRRYFYVRQPTTTRTIIANTACSWMSDKVSVEGCFPIHQQNSTAAKNTHSE